MLSFLSTTSLRSMRSFHHGFSVLCGSLILFISCTGWSYRFARAVLDKPKGEVMWLRQIHKGNLRGIGYNFGNKFIDKNIELIFTGGVGFILLLFSISGLYLLCKKAKKSRKS